MKTTLSKRVGHAGLTALLCGATIFAIPVCLNLLVHLVFLYRMHQADLFIASDGPSLFWQCWVLGLAAVVLSCPGVITLSVFSALRSRWQWRETRKDLFLALTFGLMAVLMLSNGPVGTEIIRMATVPTLSLLVALVVRIRANDSDGEPTAAASPSVDK